MPLRGAVVQSLKVRQTFFRVIVLPATHRRAALDRTTPCVQVRPNRPSPRGPPLGRYGAANPAGSVYPEPTKISFGCCCFNSAVARIWRTDADQRILRRLISVARWKVGGPLDVWVVIGTAGGRANQSDPKLFQERHQLRRVRQDRSHGRCHLHQTSIGHRRSGSGSPIRSLAGPIGQKVKDADAHSHLQCWCRGLHSRHDLAKETGSILEAATEATGAIHPAEQFVPEVAVAMLDVDEGESGLLGAHGRRDEIVDQLLQVVIG